MFSSREYAKPLGVLSVPQRVDGDVQPLRDPPQAETASLQLPRLLHVNAQWAAPELASCSQCALESGPSSLAYGDLSCLDTAPKTLSTMLVTISLPPSKNGCV